MKTTERESNHKDLHKKSTFEILQGINEEDKTVASSVEQSIGQINALTDLVITKLKSSGRLFYIGSGTSGRLGVVDASECPPTFGVPHELVQGIIAGGDQAIRKAVENAEDDTHQGWNDLLVQGVCSKDVVVGLSASGSTPYVLGALEACKLNGIQTGCIVCNSDSKIAKIVDCPIEVIVGPEFVTGSTRMKSGTAQKLILNMISTATMIKLGHVLGNRMVDMQLSNSKLVERGILMICDEVNVDRDKAKEALLEMGSVRKAIQFLTTEL